MANSNFIVQNGLTVGPLTIDAVTGNITTSGNIVATGSISSTSGNVTVVQITGNSAQFFGNASGFGAVYGGISSGFVVQTQTTVQSSANFNGYAQLNNQNINAGALASSDYVATANNGSANDTYIDLGIASSAYNFPGFGIIKPNDGYVLVQGNTTTGGGNLVLTSGLNDIVFAPGGSNANNEFGRITAGNVFAIKSTTAATSTTSGALQVAGGVGVAGAMYVGGAVVITGSLTVNGSTTTINNTVTETNEYVQTIDATTVRAVTIGNASAVLYGTLNSSSAAQTNITSVGTLTGLTVSGTVQPNANASVALGGTSAYWGSAYVNALTATGVTVNSGKLLPGANAAIDIGSTTAWFNNIYGTASHALYADLAENYLADRTYPPGTVLMFGGQAEVTMADGDTTRVAGVVSTNPAHLMNGALQGPNVTPLALTGRVPCQIIGPVAKGDLMVSAGWGYAKTNNTPAVGQVVGKALEDFPSAAKGVIEVVVGRY